MKREIAASVKASIEAAIARGRVLEAQTDEILARCLAKMAGAVDGALAADRQLNLLIPRASSLLERGDVELMQLSGKFKEEAKRCLAIKPADLFAQRLSLKCVLETEEICRAMNEHLHSPVIEAV